MDFIEVRMGELKTIDKIMELYNLTDRSGYIHTSKDWDFVRILWKYWRTNQSLHYDAFMREMEGYNAGYESNKYGVKEESGGFIQHLGNIPDTFLMLLESFFPQQRFNKDFYKRLPQEIGDFSLGNKI